MPHDPTCQCRRCHQEQQRQHRKTLASHDPIVTPGPWEYDASYAYSPARVVRRNGMVVCVFSEYEQYPTSHGNGNGNGPLIAAAPDLYRALVQLSAALDACERERAAGHTREQVRVARIAAREAIDKAGPGIARGQEWDR